MIWSQKEYTYHPGFCHQLSFHGWRLVELFLSCIPLVVCDHCEWQIVGKRFLCLQPGIQLIDASFFSGGCHWTFVWNKTSAKSLHQRPWLINHIERKWKEKLHWMWLEGMAQDSANGRDPGRWDGKQANRLVTCDKTQVKCGMYLRLHDLHDCDLQKEVATCTKATEIKSENASPEIPISHQLGRRG